MFPSKACKVHLTVITGFEISKLLNVLKTHLFVIKNQYPTCPVGDMTIGTSISNNLLRPQMAESRAVFCNYLPEAIG